jgi:hypothetical protein
MRNKLLTPWKKIIADRLRVPQLIKKFPAFYGTWMFISMFRTAHWPLATSRTRWMQYTIMHFSLRSILVVSSHKSLASGLFVSGFKTKVCISFLLFAWVLTLPDVFTLIISDENVKVWSPSLRNCIHSDICSPLFVMYFKSSQYLDYSASNSRMNNEW